MSDDEIMYKRMFELFNEDEFHEYLSREVEPLGEMANVGSIDRPKSMCVQVNPDPDRTGNPYFKVYDTETPIRGTSHVMRLHFFNSGMEYHRDKYLDWIPTNKEIRLVKEFLTKSHEDFNQDTNWQMTCYLWNLEYGFYRRKDRDDYMNGKFDNMQHPSYVPSTTQIPNSWVFP